MLLLENRKVLLKGAYGSKRYNLDSRDEDKVVFCLGDDIILKPSDSDYKMFVMPNLDDVYSGTYYHAESVNDTEDFFGIDFRRLAGMLFKPSLNLLEIFFDDDLYVDEFSSKELDKLLKLKNEFARMNLPCLYDSCRGIYFRNTTTLTNASVESMYLVKSFGYNTKKALAVYRVLDFMERFYETDFKDFKSAMTYNESEREGLLKIKYGFYSLEAVTRLLENKFEVYKSYNRLYHSHKENEELSKHIHELTKEIFFKNKDCVFA